MVRLRTLGQCVVEIGTTRLGPEAEVLFALGLYLGMEAGARHGRHGLAALFWPGTDETRGAHCLRQSVYRLRSFGATIQADRSHVWIEGACVDADFLRARRAHDHPAMESLAEEILGPFLPGYAPPFSTAFADYIERQRDVMNACARRILLGAIEAKRARGDWHAVAVLSTRCLTVDPLNEEATLASAEAAAVQGGKAKALTIIDRYLKEIGPEAREIRLPATLLRRRIAETPHLERPEPVRDAPFVGRTGDMARLTHALQLATAGQGSAQLVWGEPGIGKTRLVTEFCRTASLGRVAIERVGCQSHDERRPFSAWADLAPKLLTVPGAIGCAPESLPYLRRLYEHDPNETLPSPDTREAAVLYANIRRAILDLVDAIAAEGTLIMVIEDVHWLDGISWAVTQELVGWMATRRLLLLLTSRTPAAERAKGIADLPGLRRHHLGPLPDDAARALLDAILARRGREVPAALAEWCAVNGGGNPYYLSELALHGLRADGEPRIPASLTQLLSERLARVSSGSQRVLQACAALGKNSTVARLEGVLDMRRVALLECLDELAVHGLIVSDGARALSKHDMLSRAALDNMAPASRRLVHRHAAAVLERELPTAQEAALQWECAEQWERAGDSERALRLLRRCALHALEVGVPEEAAGLLEKALPYARTAGERREVLGEMAEALQYAGKWGDVLSTLERRRGIGESGASMEEVHCSFEVLGYEARWRCGHALEPLLAEVVNCVECVDASAHHKFSSAILGMMMADNLCDVDAAKRLRAATISYSEHFDVDALSRLHLGLLFESAFGSFARAGDLAHEVAERVAGIPTSAMSVRLSYHAALALRGAGDTDGSLILLSRAYGHARKLGLRGVSTAVANSAAWTCILTDQLSLARWWLSRAQAHLDRIRDHSAAVNVAFTRAHLALLLSDLDEAMAALAEGTGAWLVTPHSRAEMDLLTLRARLEMLRADQLPTAESVARMITLHTRTRHASAMDAVVSNFCHVLAATHEQEYASRVRGEYLNSHRRELFPPSKSLLPS